MTATIPEDPNRRRRRFRLSTMELLGFMETPVTATTRPQVPLPPDLPPKPVATPAPPEGDLFADWKPNEILTRLARAGVRWGVIVPLALLLGVMTAAAVWIYRQPQTEASAARTGLETAAVALQPDLGAFSMLSQALNEPVIDAARVNQVMLDLDGGVRRLFTAGAVLSGSEGPVRARALKIAADLSEAQAMFTQAYAYRSALIPLLASPRFETDPALVTMEEAAAAFTEWEADFESTRTSLPEGVLSEVSIQLEALSDSLEGVGADYLTALGDGDGAASAMVIDGLGEELRAIEVALFEGLEELQAQITAAIDDSRESLQNLPSLFG